MFDEGEFLDVARHLQFADSREGFQRSAISRAYYATFLLARRICSEQGWIAQTGSGSDHRNVADALDFQDHDLAVDFRTLRRLRNLADYTSDVLIGDDLASRTQHAIDLATFIRRELERLA